MTEYDSLMVYILGQESKTDVYETKFCFFGPIQIGGKRICFDFFVNEKT